MSATGRRRRPRRRERLEEKKRPRVIAPPRFLAHVIDGVAAIAAGEARDVLGAKSVSFDRTLVSFDADCEPRDLLRLRTAEDVFANVVEVHDVESGRAGRDAVLGAIKCARWDFALDARRKATGKRGRTFRVVAIGHGRTLVRREALRDEASEAIERALPRWRFVPEDAALEAWLFLKEDRVLVAVRLSDETMRHRTWKVAHLPASLRPTLAAAMVRLTKHSAGDVFCDPCCGAGTIAIERAFLGRACVLAGDVDKAARSAILLNAGEAKVRMSVFAWDAGRLPLRDESLDALATNLPFGVQIGSVSAAAALARRVMKEAERMVKRGRRVVVLCGSGRELDAAFAETKGLKSVWKHKVRLLGQPAAIRVFEKTT